MIRLCGSVKFDCAESLGVLGSFFLGRPGPPLFLSFSFSLACAGAPVERALGGYSF